MKKLILMAAAALLMMTQCRKSEVSPVTPGTVRMTVTVNQGRVSVDDDGAIKWKTGDKLWVSGVVNGAWTWLGSLDYKGTGESVSGQFSGDVVDFQSGMNCKFFYLGSGNGVEPVKRTDGTVEVSFKYQDGTLGNIQKYQLGCGKIEEVTEATSESNIVEMTSTVALAKFDFNGYNDVVVLQCDGMGDIMQVSPDGTFTGGTYKAEGANLHVTFSENSDGVVTLTNGSGPRYVVLVPTESKDYALMRFNGATEPQVTFLGGIGANKYYGKDGGLKVDVEPVYVDFGDGIKWAKFNVGANSPEGYGDYFQWGGVTPVTSTSINVDWSTCPGNDGNTTYNEEALGNWDALNVDDDDVLKPGVDAATQNWGSGWRMPTTTEWEALCSKNTIEWLNKTDESIHIAGFTAKEAGCLVIKGGNNEVAMDPSVWMFLPFAGSRGGSQLNNSQQYGYCWSSAPKKVKGNAPSMAYGMKDHYLKPANYFSRYNGQTLRAVSGSVAN